METVEENSIKLHNTFIWMEKLFTWQKFKAEGGFFWRTLP